MRVIETRLPEALRPGQPLDLRVSAISQASVALLTRPVPGNTCNRCDCVPIAGWRPGSWTVSPPASTPPIWGPSSATS